MVSKIGNLWVANRLNSKRGTCVVAVVMMQAFEPGTLPGEQLDPYGRPTDVYSFGEILLAAYQIEMDCLLRDHALGWWPLGRLHPTLSSIAAVLHKCGSLTKSLRKKADSEALVSSSGLQNLTISRHFLEGGSSTHKFVSSLMQSNTSKITNQLDKRPPISALVDTS